MKNNFIKNNTIIQYNNNASDYIKTSLTFDTGLSIGLDEKSYAIFENNIKYEMKLENSNLIIKSDKAKYKLKTQAFNPIVLSSETSENITISYDYLSNAIQFIDKSGKRPILSGVCIDNNSITSTDSYILYQALIEPGTLTKKYVINEEFIKNLLKYKQANYTISFNDNLCKCLIKLNDDLVDNVEIVGNLIGGVYPPVEKIFNQSLFSKIEIDLKEILEQTKYNDLKVDNLAITKDDFKIKYRTTGAIEIEFDGAETQEELDLLINLEQFSKLKIIDAEEIYYNPSKITFIKSTKDKETIIIMQIQH
jgi:hypothetical protein